MTSTPIRFRAILLALLAATLSFGCSSTVIPPDPSPNSRAVYLTNYGRHSSVLLPDRRGTLTEFAFGDYNWFALGRTGTSAGIRAMLWSGGSTLGRRTLELPGGGEKSIDQVTNAIDAAHVAKFAAPPDRIDALLAKLNGRFDAGSRAGAPTFGPRSHLWFVHDTEHYGLLHNCNHVTARWLRDLGCEVRGMSMLSSFKIKPSAAAATMPSVTSVLTSP